MISLPPLRNERRVINGSPQLPIYVINLRENFERRALLSLHFGNVTIFDAVSPTTIVKRGPNSLATLALETGDDSLAIEQYLKQHHVSLGAAALTISHCLILDHLLYQTDSELALVLEDDATAFLWGLSPFANLEALLTHSLLRSPCPTASSKRERLQDGCSKTGDLRSLHKPLEVLALQRIIDPHQYPPFLTGRIVRDTVVGPRSPKSVPLAPALYSTEIGLGGTTALVWNRQGMERFLKLHREETKVFNSTYGCPKDGGDCRLDFDLKHFGQAASLMPPVIGARLSQVSTIERSVSHSEDHHRHFQGELSSIESALFLFESVSLLVGQQMIASSSWNSLNDEQVDVDHLVTSFLAIKSARVSAMGQRMPTGRWRPSYIMFGAPFERYVRDIRLLTLFWTVLVTLSLFALLLILYRTCLCARRREKRTRFEGKVVHDNYFINPLKRSHLERRRVHKKHTLRYYPLVRPPTSTPSRRVLELFQTEEWQKDIKAQQVSL